MDIVKLRSLVTLADEGTISRTAEMLHLSAPAIHKRLKSLEDELDIVLYEKDGRELKLTQAAEMLLPHARALLAQFAATVAAVDEWKGVKRGYVRIGTGPTFGSYVLPALLQEFRSRYPNVELIVDMATSRDTAESLEREKLDVAFMAAIDLLETDEFEEIKRWNFDIPMVAQSDRRIPSPAPLAHLEGLPFALYKKGSLFDTLLEAYFLRIGFNPRDVMRFNSAEMIKAAIRSDMGISMLPSWMIEDDLERGLLKVVRQTGPPLTSHVALARRRLSYLPAPVKAFVELANEFEWDRSLFRSTNR